MTLRSICNQIVLAACICLVTLHPAQLRALAQTKPADFYSFDQRAKRAQEIAQRLAKCKRNSEDRRQLIEQVKSGMMSTVAASMDPNCGRAKDSLTKFSKNMAAIQRANQASDTGKFDYDSSLEFMKALRMQVLKNAALSHVDAAYRYPFMNRMTKVSTTAEKFCGGVCTPAEKAELAKTVGTYRDGFNASKQKTYASAEDVRMDLNQKLGEINRRHQAIFKELDDRVAARTKADLDYKKKQEAADKFGLRKFNKPVIDTMVDTRKVEENRAMWEYKFNQAERQEFQDRYSAEYHARMQQGAGLLLYTDAFSNEGKPLGKPGDLWIPPKISDPTLSAEKQKKSSAKKVDSIQTAVSEILNDTAELGAKTNEQYKKYSALPQNLRKYINNQGSSGDSYAAPFLDPIKEMFKTNPVAAGQILVDHPEFASLVCDLTVTIERADQRDRNKQAFFKVLAFGGMIIGGILLATGFLGPAGLALMTVSATAVSTLTLVSVGMGLTGAALNTVHTIERRKELKEEVQNTRMSMNSNTSNREISKALLEEFKTEQGNLSSNGQLVLQGALALLPFKANAIGSFLARATKTMVGEVKLMSQFSKLVSVVKNNPRAMLAMDSLDYACGALGIGSCNDVMTGINFLPKSRASGVARIKGKTLDKLTKKDVESVTLNELKSLTQGELLSHPDLLAKFVDFTNADYVRNRVVDMNVGKPAATDTPKNAVIVSEMNGQKTVQVFDARGKPVALKDVKFEREVVSGKDVLSFEDPVTGKIVKLTSDKHFYIKVTPEDPDIKFVSQFKMSAEDMQRVKPGDPILVKNAAGGYTRTIASVNSGIKPEEALKVSDVYVTRDGQVQKAEVLGVYPKGLTQIKFADGTVEYVSVSDVRWDRQMAKSFTPGKVDGYEMDVPHKVQKRQPSQIKTEKAVIADLIYGKQDVNAELVVPDANTPIGRYAMTMKKDNTQVLLSDEIFENSSSSGFYEGHIRVKGASGLITTGKVIVLPRNGLGSKISVEAQRHEGGHEKNDVNVGMGKPKTRANTTLRGNLAGDSKNDYVSEGYLLSDELDRYTKGILNYGVTAANGQTMRLMNGKNPALIKMPVDQVVDLNAFKRDIKEQRGVIETHKANFDLIEKTIKTNPKDVEFAISGNDVFVMVKDGPELELVNADPEFVSRVSGETNEGKLNEALSQYALQRIDLRRQIDKKVGEETDALLAIYENAAKRPDRMLSGTEYLKTRDQFAKINKALKADHLNAQVKETPDVSKPSQKTKVDYKSIKFEKGKVTTDEDGSWYIGYDRIAIKGEKGEEIGFLSYHIDEDEPDLLTIGWSKVDENHRGKGYQEAMFKKLFADHPEVQRIRTTFDESNIESFNKVLASKIKKRSDYSTPGSVTIDKAKLDRMTSKGEPNLRELNECCSDFLKKLKSEKPDEYSVLMKEAVKGTPAWKTRDKFGFGSFGDMTNFKLQSSKDGTVQVFVEFDAQKVK